MKKIPLSLLCGICAIVATVVMYFVILNNVVLEAIHFISLLAIVFAEALTTFYAWLAKGSPRKVAAAIVSAVMIPYSLVLSFVYIVSFPNGYSTYTGLYIAGMVVVNAIALILCFFDSGKKAEDDQLQAAKENILMLRKMVKCVMADEAAKPYEAQLRSLEERLHFTNDCVIVPEDEQIRQMLAELQQNTADPDFDVAGQIARIDALVKKRTVMTA